MKLLQPLSYFLVTKILLDSNMLVIPGAYTTFEKCGGLALTRAEFMYSKL